MKKDRNSDSDWAEHPLEERYLAPDRKQDRKDRKIASSQDRSKYKKTDQDKRQPIQEIPNKESLLRGRVLSMTSRGAIVACDKGTFVCHLRGFLKKEKTLSKNLVTVGDWVLIELTAPQEGIIAFIEPRLTQLSRADNLSRRKEQLIAANVDQVMITVSVVTPPLKPALVDRYLIAAYKGGLTPIILVNKVDLLNDPDQDPVIIAVETAILEEFVRAHEKTGEKVILISAVTGQGLDTLEETMRGKTSVFSGQSGVGKSCLLNAIGQFGLRVGETVERTRKGAHTTSNAQLLPLSFGGWCVDTPGVQSFGVWDLKKEDIRSYFSEIDAFKSECHYPNCTHCQEPGCAARKAAEEGKISPLRYDSYQALMESIGLAHQRR